MHCVKKDEQRQNTNGWQGWTYYQKKANLLDLWEICQI